MTGHQPVMLEPALDAWLTDPDGLYVDGTFGRGGHSQALLDRLGAAGRLLGIDKDPQAVATDVHWRHETLVSPCCKDHSRRWLLCWEHKGFVRR